ncbi:MAG: type VI secretion system baseplate subunit TssK [Bryobacteraceae bacterium]
MKLLSRVVWSEGMHLAPHHFQTQSRYFEDAIHFAASTLWFKPYGLAACQMDAEALENGTLALLHARGVLDDGLPFQIPSPDSAPSARAIASIFPPTADSQIVLLAIPSVARNSRMVGDGESIQFRYLTEEQVLADETSGTDEAKVALGRKNFRLVLESEPHDTLASLPVARVRRDGSGRFVYDETFIPPCLELSASPRLNTLTRQLVEIMTEKSDALGGGARAAQGEALADYFRRDLGSFWFLHTVRSSLGVLRHLLLTKHGHPEELYREMARLGGALCSFSLQVHPRDLPLYDHDRLTDCFHTLHRQIRELLELLVPTSSATIALEPAGNYFYAGAVADPRWLDNSRWLLEVRASAGEAEVITLAPRLVKLCSERFVPELVKRAVPGLTLTHVPTPPPAVPARADAQYFGVTKQGPCWDHIVATRRVGAYVPGDLPDARLALWVINDR